ncbi:glycoside hydrolase family 3 N-terminal domain-containing protein [Streptomyces capparidis]
MSARPPADGGRYGPRTAMVVSAALLAGLLPLGLAAGPASADDPAPLALDRFEGEVPFAAPPEAGIFPWGGDADDPPKLTLAEREDAPEGDSVLQGTYDISSWGGFTRHVSHDQQPQDWSAHKGLRFWWYGQNEGQVPPGTGKRIHIEVKDGGANAEASELWTTSFTDDWTGWHLVEIPFSQLKYRQDYQPVGGIDQVLGLTRMWGYGITLPTGGKAEFAMDGVELYGKAEPVREARVVADAVHPVAEGGTAKVRLSVATTGGTPLKEPVTVRWATGEGTAQAGRDYTAASGMLTFPAGTASGTYQTVAVRTLKDRASEVAETVPVTLTAEGADLPAEQPGVVIDAHGLPYLDRRLPVAKRVADLLSRMTLEEKVGQMTQAERGALTEQDDIADYALGSLLSGGGSTPTPNTAEAWAAMIDSFQLRTRETRLQIPLIYGVDSVHGHNNLVGATVMPHNIGLGASRDPQLARRTAEVTAEETRATGVPWTFAPCLCVTRDDRWGRVYEAFGEDPALVTAMETVIQGFQGRADGSELDEDTRVLATAKHYVGDGGTEYGSSATGSYTIDQGVTKVTRQELEAVHLDPYDDAVRRGVGSVMPSFSSVDIVGDDKGPVKMHANAELLTDVLKGRMKFGGFVISDWQAIDQIPGDYASDVRTSINAGLDMIMVPYEYRGFTGTLLDEVEAGRVPVTRVDDAVARILTQKFRLGLFEKPYADTSHLDEIGSAKHRAVARQAAAESQVLLKNDGGLLPLPRKSRLYVAGSNADDLGNQSGGWTITWQGSSGDITEGTTILEGIKQVAPKASVTFSEDASAPTAGHDTGVVVVGETPYAEGVGDVGNGHDLELSDADKRAVDTVCGAMKCVVLVVSGRPQLLADQVGDIDALVASWLPGTEGAGVADTLFGQRDFTGRLPVSWPRSEQQIPVNVGDTAYDPLFPYGWGLTTEKTARKALVEARVGHAALRIADWRARPERVLDALARDAARLPRSSGEDGYRARDAVVSAARHVAQTAIVAHGAERATAALTSDADHLLLKGDAAGAVAKLAKAYRVATG